MEPNSTPPCSPASASPTTRTCRPSTTRPAGPSCGDGSPSGSPSGPATSGRRSSPARTPAWRPCCPPPRRRSTRTTARGTFVEVGGEIQPAPAPRFGRTPADRPAPRRTRNGTSCRSRRSSPGGSAGGGAPRTADQGYAARVAACPELTWPRALWGRGQGTSGVTPGASHPPGQHTTGASARFASLCTRTTGHRRGTLPPFPVRP